MKNIILWLLLCSSIFASYIGSGWSPITGADDTVKKEKTNNIVISMPHPKDSIFSLPVLQHGYEAEIKEINYQNRIITFYIVDYNDKVVGEASYTNETLSSVYNLSDAQKTNLKNLQFQVEQDDLADFLVDQIKNPQLFDEINLQENGIKYITTSRLIFAAILVDNSIINVDLSLKSKRIVLRPDVQLKEVVISERFQSGILYFVLEVMASLNDILSSLKLVLMGFIIPITIAYVIFKKGSVTLQKIPNHDDLIEKGLIAILILVVFYLQSPVTDSSNQEAQKGEIRQSVFQEWFALAVGWGVEKADEATVMINTAYLKYQASNIGLTAKKDIDKSLERSFWLENISENNQQILEACHQAYDMQKIRMWVQKNQTNEVFPSREQLENGQDWFQNDGVRGTKLSLTACRNAEAQNKIIRQEIEYTRSFVNAIATGGGEDRNKSMMIISSLIDISTVNAAGLGFLHAPFIAAMDGGFRNILNDAGFNPKDTLKSEKDMIDEVIENLAYAFVPGFDSVERGINTGMHSMASLGNLTGVGLMVGAFNKLTLGVFEKLGDAIINITSFSTALWLMYTFVSFLPILSITLAGILVFGWLVVSAFAFYVAAPFLAIYMLATDQTDKLKNFVVRGGIFVLKPLLIVISTLLALILAYIFQYMGTHVVEIELDSILSVLNAGNTATAWDRGVNSIAITLTKGFTYLALQLISVIGCFYIVLRGPDYILGLVDVNQSKSVDARESVPESDKAAPGRYIS